MTQPIKMPYEKLRILIADNLQDTQRSTRMMLSINPDVNIVAVAQDGASAVELANQHKPDIAIMNVNLPEVDGLTAYEKMLETQPTLACIFVSGEKDYQVLDNAPKTGVCQLLIRPFTVDQLNTVVYRVGRIIKENRQRTAQTGRLREQRVDYLIRLASEYARSHRTDDQALEVFENLARDPQCELRWLMNLAMLYVIRKKWGKLRELAARLEEQDDEQTQ